MFQDAMATVTGSGILGNQTAPISEAQGFKPMPASIVKAILAVQKQVVKLVKENVNDFGKFNYTSVDQIYELLGHKLAEAGLVIMPYEIEGDVRIHDIKGIPTRFGYFKIGFLYATETDTWTDPSVCETIEAKLEGAVTFHGIKSLAQKTHLRGAFKVPTGEEDLSGKAPDEGVPPVKAPASARLSAEDSYLKQEEIIAEIAKLPIGGKGKNKIAPETAEAFTNKWGSTINNELIAPHADTVRAAYKKRNNGETIEISQ